MVRSEGIEPSSPHSECGTLSTEL